MACSDVHRAERQYTAWAIRKKLSSTRGVGQYVEQAEEGMPGDLHPGPFLKDTAS